MKIIWKQLGALPFFSVVPYPHRLSTFAWRGLFAWVGWILTKSWQGLLRFVILLWGSIPDYLPFYLLVVLVLYAGFKGRKPATVIAPFQLPHESKLPFSERTVANSLQDALVVVRREAVDGIARCSRQLTGVGSQGLTGLKLPEVTHFEVPIQFAVEVKGLSHEALVSLARKVLRREHMISGDVIVDGKKFILIARGQEKGPWSTGLKHATPRGLQDACRTLALKMLQDFSPTLVAAHEIAEGRFEAAYERLQKLIRDG